MPAGVASSVMQITLSRIIPFAHCECALRATKRKAIPLECAFGMAIFSSRFATAKMQLRVFSRRNCAYSKPDQFLSDGMQSFTAFPTFKYMVCIIGSLQCHFHMETQLKLLNYFFIKLSFEWAIRLV
jgi:hypothetical protein